MATSQELLRFVAFLHYIVSVISSPSHFTTALHLEAQLRGRYSVQAFYCALLTRVTTARLPGRLLIGHLLPAVPPPIGQLAGAESGSGQEMWSTNTGQLSGVLGILYILCHLSYGLCPLFILCLNLPSLNLIPCHATCTGTNFKHSLGAVGERNQKQVGELNAGVIKSCDSAVSCRVGL